MDDGWSRRGLRSGADRHWRVGYQTEIDSFF
jgi:hypothetical protein